MAGDDLAGIVMEAVARPAAYPEGRFDGRGIVICAGGLRYFTCAFVLLHVLRHALGSELPVQVWHLGRREMSPAMRRILEAEGAEVVDAEPLLARHPATIRNGWALKPYAVAHSRFAEVLSLDADALPLMAPDDVFLWPEYQRDGALFWPDRLDLAAENPVWAALGLPPRREISLETGQFVLDKRRAWPVLDLTIALNSHSNELYEMIYGEKDSFLLSFLALQRGFARIEHRPLMFDSDLIQRRPDGTPFIHHRTFSKYLLHGPNRPVFGDLLTPVMEAALAVLRRRWTGIAFHPPEMSPAARAMADAIVGQRFAYQTSGAGTRTLVLDPDHQVGEGRAEYEQHWALIERDGGLVLQLFSATRLAIELHPQADGSWSGVTAASLAFSARLVPEDAAATMAFSGTERVGMTSADLVGTLLNAAVPGAGTDAETMAELVAALSLLNRVHDDVPEAMRDWLAGRRLHDEALLAFASRLAVARDLRIASVRRSIPPIDLLRPGFYETFA